MTVPWNATGEAATATITNTFPAPPIPPGPTPSPSGGTPTDGALPVTGDGLRIPIALGLAVLLAGLALTGLGRRRRG